MQNIVYCNIVLCSVLTCKSVLNQVLLCLHYDLRQLRQRDAHICSVGLRDKHTHTQAR